MSSETHRWDDGTTPLLPGCCGHGASSGGRASPGRIAGNGMISRMKHGRRGHLDAATCGDPARVASHLFVGTTLIARDVNLLRAIGITHVLNAGGTSNWMGTRLGLELMQRDLADEPGWALAPHLQETYAFIDRARASGGACLVCSDRGISRCGAIAAYYLMRSEKISYTDAMSEIIEVRSCCCPNSGFVSELNALSDVFEQKVPAAPSSRRTKRDAAPAHLPLLSEAARRAHHARSLRGDSTTRWRVGIDPKLGHVVRVGIESDGFRSGSGVAPMMMPIRGGALGTLGTSRGRADLEAQRRRKEAREMEQLLTEHWEQEQRQQQQKAKAMQRSGSPRNGAGGREVLGGMYTPASPRLRGISSARGLAAGCTIGSHRGCLCQICFMNDATARARSARLKNEVDIHPDLAALSSFSG